MKRPLTLRGRKPSGVIYSGALFMPTLTSKAPVFTHTSQTGSRSVQLEFIWANELGGIAQAVIATFQDDTGKPLKQFTVSGPFSEPGSARKAVIAKANAWFDHGHE